MKQKIFAWACDFSPFRGEGILARSFAIDFSIKKKIDIYIKSPENFYHVKKGKIKEITKNNKKNINFRLLNNYLWPIKGIFYLWKLYFQKKKIMYLNFMPLWNFILFYFLPPKVFIGPITGFNPKKKIENYSGLIRLILIPIFFRLSMFVFFKRFKNLMFSTNLLEKNFFNKSRNSFYFNYLISSNLNKKISANKNRKIDFLIYNRNYSVKEHYKLNNLIKYLLKKNYNVHCVGDHLKLQNLKNHNIISRERVKKLLKSTKLVISSPENPYSLFTLDAIKMGSKILFDIKYRGKLSFLKYNFKQYINLDKPNYKYIEKTIKQKKNNNQLDLRELISLKKRNSEYFRNIIV
mgnify:FL=1|jgi:hypothetical protein